MDAATGDRLDTSDLSTVLKRVAFDREAADIAVRCVTVSEALDRLVESGFLAEATTLVAHALPRREAVWWACMCAHHTAPATLSACDRLAVRAARSWARHPRGATRRRAMERAESAGLATPEAWAAVAAFWSEPGDEALVPLPTYLTGVAVAGAVGLAAIRGGPHLRTERLRQFLASAREIALGGEGRIPLRAA